MQTNSKPNRYIFTQHILAILPFSLVCLLCKIALIWSFPQQQDQQLKETHSNNLTEEFNQNSQ